MKIKQHPIKIFVLFLLFTNAFIFIGCGQKQESEEPMPPLFEKFKYTSEQAIFEQHSYFNFTNQSSVSPNIEKFGLKTVFTPPYFFNPFAASFMVFGNEVTINSYTWYPSESIFIGETINGISTSARVIPLAEKRGGIYEIVLTNTTSEKVDVPVNWSFQGKPGRVKNWGFYGNRTMQASEEDATIASIESGYSYTLDNSEASIVGFGATYQFEDDGVLKSSLGLKPGDSVKTGIVFVLGKNDGQTSQIAKSIANDIPEIIATTRKHWESELTNILDNAPKLEGVPDELQAFYNTGLLSLQSAKWEVPEFLFSPWYGSCGIDGGAMISYLWEMSYSSKYVSILSPEIIRKHLLAYAEADMSKCYAVSPERGEGVGPLYSYNFYNLARLVYDYVCLTGDFAFLDEPVGDIIYLEYLYNFSLLKEDLDKPADLIDYGNTHNLLEMYKTDAYEHYVPSPNSERLLIYDMLTELYTHKGRKTPHDLIKRKEELTKGF